MKAALSRPAPYSTALRPIAAAGARAANRQTTPGGLGSSVRSRSMMANVFPYASEVEHRARRAGVAHPSVTLGGRASPSGRAGGSTRNKAPSRTMPAYG